MRPGHFAAGAAERCDTAWRFGERQWCLATSGNFSARVEPDQFLITKSGRQKSDLDPGDLMLCDDSGAAVDQHNTPSAETPLHARLYELDAGIDFAGRKKHDQALSREGSK